MTDRRQADELALIEAVARGWPPPYRLAFTWQRVTIACWLAIAVNLPLWAFGVRDDLGFWLAGYTPWLANLGFELVGRRVIRNGILPRRIALGRRALALEAALIVAVALPYVLLAAVGERAEFVVLAVGLGVVAVLVRPAASWVDLLTAERQDDDEREREVREREDPGPETTAAAAAADPYPATRFDLGLLAVGGLALAVAAYVFLPHRAEDGPYARAVLPLLLLVGAGFGLWRGLLKVRALEADRVAEEGAARGASVGRFPARDVRRAAVLDLFPTGLGLGAALVRALAVLGIGALIAESLVDEPTLPWVAAGIVFLLDRTACAIARRSGGRAQPLDRDWSSAAVAEVAESMRASDRAFVGLFAVIALGIVGAAWWLIDADGLGATHPAWLALAAGVVVVVVVEASGEAGATTRSRPAAVGVPRARSERSVREPSDES